MLGGEGMVSGIMGAWIAYLAIQNFLISRHNRHLTELLAAKNYPEYAYAKARLQTPAAAKLPGKDYSELFKD